MKAITETVLAVAIVAAGMLGLYFHIEYSGWVLFVGLICAIGAAA